MRVHAIARIVGFALLMALAAGCLAPATGPVIERRGVKRTYSVPKVDIRESESGFRFVTNHFDLQFDTALGTTKGFETLAERTSRGKGAMLFLESQYAFLREVLGIGAPMLIEVIVYPNIRGDERDAHASVVAERGVMRAEFGIQAFFAQDVRAHEMTHAFTAVYGLPAWLDEGLAVLVEGELAGGAEWAKQNRSLTLMRPIGGGPNPIQSWRRQGSTLPFRDETTYSFSYSIIAELRDRYGDVFFQRFFQGIHEAVVAERRLREHSDEEIVALMSRAADADLRPFFVGELRFKLGDKPSAPTSAGTEPVLPPLE